VRLGTRSVFSSDRGRAVAASAFKGCYAHVAWEAGRRLDASDGLKGAVQPATASAFVWLKLAAARASSCHFCSQSSDKRDMRQGYCTFEALGSWLA